MLTLNGEVLIHSNKERGTIRIESGDNIINVEIFNLDGRLQFKQDYSGDSKVLTISVAGYEPGIYYLTIVSASARYTQKIVVS